MTEEVKPLIEVDDSRLLLVEHQTPRCQPCAQTSLDLFGLLGTGAHRHEVIRVSNHDGAFPHRRTSPWAGVLVPDPGRLLHPEKRHVQQQGGEDSSNAIANFEFDVALTYRRGEKPFRKPRKRSATQSDANGSIQMS